MKEKMMNKAIFWDSDGTLLYGNESFAESFVKSCKGVGYEISIEKARELMRDICSWYRPEIDHSNQDGEEWWKSLLSKIEYFCKEAGLTDKQISSILPSFRENVISYDYKAYNDANEILKYFKLNGFRNYIISNNFPELNQVFERLGLDEYISGYITSAGAGYEKPNIKIFEIAMQMAEHPEICYMIGDNPKTDYAGGKAVGMNTILVHNQSPECEHCCECLLDLKAYFG